MTDTPRTLRSSHLVLVAALLGAVLAIVLGLLAGGSPAPVTAALVLGGLLAVTAGLSKTCTP